MKSVLNILHLEDDPNDVEIIQSLLQAEGFPCNVKAVQTRNEFIVEISKGGYDLILADYALPSFDGMAALKLAREKCPNVPFILLSGSLGEELAIESLKSGATDYVLKQRIRRLVPAVQRALSEADERKRRKKAEEAHQESESKYRTLFSESMDVVFMCTLEGRFTDINPAGLRLFGYSQEEIMQVDIARDLYVNPNERKTFQQNISRDGFVKDYQVILKRKNGERINALETATAVRNDKGEIIAYRGIIKDMTEQKKLERQLFNIQKLESIGLLAGGIAHDFNNLLTAISGYADLLSIKVKGDEGLLQDVMGIQKASQRATNLTRQLLTFSRQQIIEPKVININDLISDLNKMLHRLIGEDILLETNLFDKIGYIKADPGQIEQILINLVVNAVDAIRAIREKVSEKRITIDTKNVTIDEFYTAQHPESREGNYVLLTVSDTGEGIKKEIMDKIFDPFFSTKPKGEGTGLGLATVYGIVKQNGGFINLYSEPDNGTIFKIYWPICDDEELQGFERDKAATILHGNETILFVEDDEGVRSFGFDAMESLGYKVIEASNGSEALKIIEDASTKIDLVITDVIMPRMGGKELSDKISQMKPEIKVLFSSGYTNSQIAKSGILEKGIHFIIKPYSVSELSQKIREVLDGKS